MDKQHDRQLHKFLAVADFVTTSPLPPPLATTPAFTAHVSALQAGITAVQQAAQEQLDHRLIARQRVVERNAIRHRIRTQLLRIKRIARIIDHESPGVVTLVTVPDRNASEAHFIRAAQSAVDQLTPLQAIFEANGMAPDFLGVLTQLSTAIEATSQSRTTSRRHCTTANAAVPHIFKRLRDAVTRLDVMIRTQCDADPANGPTTVAAWTRALDVLWAPKPASASTTHAGSTTQEVLPQAA